MIESEIEISADLVRDLLRDQHPDLAELPIREVEGGWGNQMWRLGDELAVRMQRMDTEPRSQLKERRWLPTARPAPAAADPGPGAERCAVRAFPQDLDGHDLGAGHCRWTTGRSPAASTRPTPWRRSSGRCMWQAPADAPVDSDRGAHPKDCTDGFEHFFDAVDADAIGSADDDVRAVWDDAVAAPAWEGPPVWVHGDLHPANVVVADGTLAGVVDFGDALRRRPGVGPGGRLGAAARGRAPHGSSTLRAGGRGDGPAGPRAGRDEEPVPDADGPERGPRPARRQAELGSRRPVGARSRPEGPLTPASIDCPGAGRPPTRGGEADTAEQASIGTLLGSLSGKRSSGDLLGNAGNLSPPIRQSLLTPIRQPLLTTAVSNWA